MGYLEEHDFSKEANIPEFYKGKTILITGGTGFMGKVLIEKLLYSCSELDRIYILMRPKKGASIEDRLSALYDSRCFDRLRKDKPDIFKSKVHIIGGDMLELGLGISQDDRTLLINKLNIIFHVAASVRFDDSLTYATKLNLRGTREVIDLAKEIRNLKVFVHVSTSYSNTNRDPIGEQMYPSHADWRDTIDICEKFDEATVKSLTHKYLNNIPNTYTFTKQLAEEVVYEQRGILPLVMVRPSIVISSFEEPCPGWVESFNGPIGILIANAKGIMRSIYSDPDLVADYIPCDFAIRHIIAAGWVRGIKKLKPTDEMPIFNCCAANLNNMTMGEIQMTGKELIKDQPLQDILWVFSGKINNSMLKHYITVIFLHLFPAILVDILLKLIGQKPRLLKIQRKIYVANLAISYYITNQWTFINDNFLKLRTIIKAEDSPDFNYYVERVDKYDYFKQALTGARWYLLKEPDEDLPKAAKHSKRMYYVDLFVKVSVYSYLAWRFWKSSYFTSLINLTV